MVLSHKWNQAMHVSWYVIVVHLLFALVTQCQLGPIKKHRLALIKSLHLEN